jgi:hypothetical protein
MSAACGGKSDFRTADVADVAVHTRPPSTRTPTPKCVSSCRGSVCSATALRHVSWFVVRVWLLAAGAGWDLRARSSSSFFVANLFHHMCRNICGRRGYNWHGSSGWNARGNGAPSVWEPSLCFHPHTTTFISWRITLIFGSAPALNVGNSLNYPDPHLSWIHKDIR